jgi:hypothetical protein
MKLQKPGCRLTVIARRFWAYEATDSLVFLGSA